VAANRFTQVSANQCGLLDRTTDEARLGLNAQLGWSSMVGSGPAEDAIAVPAITLDTYVEQRGIDPATISFVKIDVEGAEPQVLLGARQTLARAPSAALLIEWVPERFPASGHSPDEVTSLLQGLGFAPYAPVWRRRRHQFKLVPGSDPGVGLDLLFMRPNGGR
jgi:FkbM family methyltransferase